MIPIAKPNIGKEEIDAVVEVMKSGAIASGPVVKDFEKKFAAEIGTNHGIACSSGTSALFISLEAAVVEKGDEVITTPFTFIATSNALLYNGATPVFAEEGRQIESCCSGQHLRYRIKSFGSDQLHQFHSG